MFLAFIDAIRKTIPDAMRDIMTCEPSYIMMGMSAETFWGGLDGNVEFEARLRDTIGPQIGLTSGAAALKAALDAFGVRRVAALTEGQGVAADLLTPTEAGDKWPVMCTDDLKGAVWLPGDGKANPTDITQALAKGARQGGVRIFEKTRVTGLKIADGTIRGVATDKGDIAADIVVNCAGQWARALGRMAGVAVPLYSCEHMYIVTKRIDGVFPDLPCLRASSATT